MNHARGIYTDLPVISVGKGVAVSSNYNFVKGDFLLEYRVVLKDEDNVAAMDPYICEFCYKKKSMW